MDRLTAQKLPTAVLNTWYDQIALGVSVAAGNYRMGVYVESASLPATLYTQTGTITMVADYHYETISEFEITNTANWAAFTNSQSFTGKTVAGTSGDKQYLESQPITLPSSFPGSPTANANPYQMKIGHS